MWGLGGWGRRFHYPHSSWSNRRGWPTRSVAGTAWAPSGGPDWRGGPMPHPADLRLDAPLEVANWRPLVHWLLALPHLLIAGVLGQVAGVVAFVSWFIIVFTGKLPAGIADFQSLAIRYQARAYSYAAFLRESYPAFEFEVSQPDPGTDPLVVDITAELEDRN